MNPSELADAIRAQRPLDETEAEHVRRLGSLLRSAPDPFSRHNLGGHITASAIVWDRVRDTVLLVRHPTFDEWLQPGGHCEPQTDSSVHAAALRELIEETHLTPADVELVSETPLDIDVHSIPATEAEPAHEHYDIRYLFRFVGTNREPQSPDVKWVAVADLLDGPDDSLARIARKLLDSQQR